MVERATYIDLGIAVLMFLVGALVVVIPGWSVGIAVFGLALIQFGRVYATQGWALVNQVIGVWLVVLSATTMITPAWGIPLLFITAGVQLVLALATLGVVVDLVLLAWVAYVRDTPFWTVAVLLIVAAGKLLWLAREHLETDGSDDRLTPT